MGEPRTQPRRAHLLMVVACLVAASCTSDDEGEATEPSIRSGTTEEFCAAYAQLQAEAADFTGTETVEELIGVLGEAIEAQLDLPVPSDLTSAARMNLKGLLEAVDRFEDLDPSISLSSPTAEQQEEIESILETLDGAEAGATTMREYAEANCDPSGG